MTPFVAFQWILVGFIGLGLSAFLIALIAALISTYVITTKKK